MRHLFFEVQITIYKKEGMVYTIALSLFVLMPKIPPSPPDARIDNSLKILLKDGVTMPFANSDTIKSMAKYTPARARPFKSPLLVIFFARTSAPKKTDTAEIANITAETVLSEMFEKYTTTARMHTSTTLIKSDKNVPVNIFLMLIKKPPE